MTNQDDPYGFRARFRGASVEKLVEAFNGDVGKPGRVSARGGFHSALRDAFLATGLDCSSFIDAGGGISLRHRIRLDADKFVTITDAPPASRTSPEEGSPDRRELFYGIGRGGLLLVEPSTALDLAVFHTAHTWGELRQGAPSLYQDAIMQLADDGEVFDRSRLRGFQDGDFPAFPEQLMLDILPESIRERFGTVAETVHNGPLLKLDSGQINEVIKALREEGFTCTLRQDLIDKMS